LDEGGISLEAAFGFNRAFQLYLCSDNVFVLSVFSEIHPSLGLI